LTKADLLTAEQHQEVIQFFRQTLQRELNRNCPSISTPYATIRNGNNILWKWKSSTISRQPGLRIQEDPSVQDPIPGQSLLSYLEIALKTALQADQDREGLRVQILSEKVNEDLMREETGGLIFPGKSVADRPLIQTYLDQFQEPLTKKVVAKLEKRCPHGQATSGNCQGTLKTGCRKR